MAFCGQVNIPTVNNDAIACNQYYDTNCVIYQDPIPYFGFTDPSTSTEVFNALISSLQDARNRIVTLEGATGISFDLVPTDGSTNAVQSNGIFDALAVKLEDAPSDGTQYARQNGAWVAVAGGASNVLVGDNVAVATTPLPALTSGIENTSFGDRALENASTANTTVAIGDQAGFYADNTESPIEGSTTELTIVTDGIFIGAQAKPLANNSVNEIVIGARAHGNGNNTATIGALSTIETYLRGDVFIEAAAGTGLLTTAGGAVFNDSIVVQGGISVLGLVDGRDIATDGTKLDGIEAGATADQLAAEVPIADVASNFTATDVEGALAELSDAIAAGVSDGDKGDITVSGSGTTWTIDPQAVTFGKIQNVGTGVFAGRVSSGSGALEELSGADAMTLLPQFSTTTTAQGVVPGSNNVGATFYLDATGNWSEPPGASGATELVDLTDVSDATQTNGNVLVSDGSTFASRPLVQTDISDFGNYVTIDTAQTITASKTFSGIVGFTGFNTQMQRLFSGISMESPLWIIDNNDDAALPTINTRKGWIIVNDDTGGEPAYFFATIGQGTSTGGTFANNEGGYLNFQSLTAQREYDFPDASGTIALTSDLVGSYVDLTSNQSVAGEKTFTELLRASDGLFVSGVGAAITTANDVDAVIGGNIIVGNLSSGGTISMYPISSIPNYTGSASTAYFEAYNDGGSVTGWLLTAETQANSAVFNFGGLSADRTYDFPDATGTIALTSDVIDPAGVYLPLAGDTMTGAIDMNENSITNVDLLRLLRTGSTEDMDLFLQGTSPNVEFVMNPNDGGPSLSYDYVANEWQVGGLAIATGTGSTGLELITENSQTGWRLVGQNAANYGDIGDDAVDLSQSTVTSSTRGATGLRSFAANTDTTASNTSAFAINNNSVASGINSFAGGQGSLASGLNAFAFGDGAQATSTSDIAMGDGAVAEGSNSLAFGLDANASGLQAVAFRGIASGTGSYAFGQGSSSSGVYSYTLGRNSSADADYSYAIGYQVTAYSYNEVSMGTWETVYVPNSTFAFNAADRAFNIGNGTSSGARSDAFTVLKGGEVLAPSVDNTKIGAASNKVLITKEYADANYAGGGGATQLSELSDVNTSTPTNRNVLVADGVDFESRALVEADISDLGSYVTLGTTQTITATKTLTATPALTFGSDAGAWDLQYGSNFLSFIPGNTSGVFQITNDGGGATFTFNANSGDTTIGGTTSRLNVDLINSTGTTQSTSITTGAIVTDGGLGVALNAYVGGQLLNTDNTASTSKDTGAVIVTLGGLGVEGAINAGGDITAFASSDERLKDDMKRLHNPMDILSKVSGYTFIWNDKQGIYEGEDIGVKAQEVMEVMPSAVRESSPTVGGWLQVNYDKFAPVLIEAVKEKDVEIKELKAQLQTQGQKVQSYERRIGELEKTVQYLLNKVG